MPKKPSGIAGLADANTWETQDPAVFGLEIVDTLKRSFAAVTDSTGITFITGKLLDLACDPVFATASKMTGRETPRCHIVGTRIELSPGRDATEIATTLTIGCVELVVFLPLAEVLRSMAVLGASIERDGSPPGLH